MEKEEYRCIVCGKEKRTLIVINTQDDEHEIFVRRRGICKDCLLKTDLDSYAKEFVERKLKEELEHAENQVEFLKEEINKQKGGLNSSQP